MLLVILMTGAFPHPTCAEDAPEVRPPPNAHIDGSTQAYTIPKVPDDSSNFMELDEFPEPQVNPTPTAVSAELLERENQPIGAGSKRPERSARSAFSSTSAGKNWWFEGIMSLAAVLMLVGILAYVVRKWLPGARQLDRAGLEILGKTHLSPKQSLAVVKIGRRLVMIGITPDRISSLATIDEPAEVAAMLADFSGAGRTGLQNRFGAWMDRAESDFTQLDEPMTRGMDQEPARYRRAQHQVRGLLGKVKSMTAGGTMTAPTPKT